MQPLAPIVGASSPASKRSIVVGPYGRLHLVGAAPGGLSGLVHKIPKPVLYAGAAGLAFLAWRAWSHRQAY